MQKYLLAFVVGLVISGGGTPLARRLAVALGAVDEPDSRRANLSPTPRLGGLAVFLATGAALTAVALWDDRAAGALFANHPMALAGIAAITIVTVVGAVDDVHSLSARVKLAAELCAGAIAFAGGFRIEEVFGISLGALSLPVSMLWMATIANAFNLIDGLDGLAAGTGVIVGITLGLLSLEIGNVGSALLLSALCGALSGFLPYNIRRAKLFLGDSGALLVGTLIALCSIQTSNKLATGVAFLIPALAMGFPLGEVALTVMRRTLRALRVTRLDDRGGRYAFLKRGSSALFTPDRDHIHHRLLQLGFTTRRAVLVLHSATALACGCALILVALRGSGQAVLLGAFALAVGAAIRHLGYEELHPFGRGLFMPILEPAIRRREIQAILDIAFIAISFFGAVMLGTHGVQEDRRALLLNVMPFFVLAQIAAFATCGLYRRSFHHIGVGDLMPIGYTLAAACGAGWLVAVALGLRFDLVRLLLDGYFLATLVLGARIIYPLLEYMVVADSLGTRRVVIYGAGRAGVAALREIRCNPEMQATVVGFLDDEPEMIHKRVQGITVLESASIDSLIADEKFDELVIASPQIDASRLSGLAAKCAAAGLRIERFEARFGELVVASLTAATERVARRLPP